MKLGVDVLCQWLTCALRARKRSCVVHKEMTLRTRSVIVSMRVPMRVWFARDRFSFRRLRRAFAARTVERNLVMIDQKTRGH